MASAFKVRLKLPWGWAEAESHATVFMGEHLVPEALRVWFVGVEGQPELRMRLAIVNGEPQCRELTLAAKPDGRQVRDLDTRGVKLDEWTTGIYSLFALKVVGQADGRIVTELRDTGEAEAEADRLFARLTATSRRTSAGRLQRIADVYRANLADGPIVAVARHEGVGLRMAYNLVKQAEQSGLLPATARAKRRASDVRTRSVADCQTPELDDDFGEHVLTRFG